MKILLLTPIHDDQKHNSNKKIQGVPYYQTQASWIRALEELGHSVNVFIYTESIIIPHNKYIAALMQKFSVTFARVRRITEKYYKCNPENYIRSFLLMKKISVYKPDIIIISGGISHVLSSSFKDDRKTQILLFSGVNPNIASTNLEKELIKNGPIDYVVENDQGYAESWKKIGAKKTIVLPISSVDPKIHIKSNSKKKFDVIFIGSITADRLEKLRHFTSFNFKFWGDVKPGVVMPKDMKKYYGGEAFGKQMLEILQSSKIVLNFQPSDMTTGGNMRTFEIPAVGAFMLVDRVDTSWFKEIQPVTFNTIEEAKKKIEYYLKHEHERLEHAKKLQKYVLSNHTYKIHLNNLFNQIQK